MSSTTTIPTADTRRAARVLGATTEQQRNAVLATLAGVLRARSTEIAEANARDIAAGHERGLSAALIDRLMLDAARIEAIAAAVEDVAALPDPLGEVVEQRTLSNGLRLQRVRVPFGVVCVVFEARPNVAIDAAAIAIKTGNGIVLRGSSSAIHSNEVLVSCVHEALAVHGLDAACVLLVDPTDRESFRELIATEGSVDLVIPRGGEALKKFLYEHARVPILAAAGGNNHVFVDRDADPDIAEAIVVNAKVQRPGVCNAAETLLVHAECADSMLPRLRGALETAGVELRDDDEALGIEFLDLIMAVRVVDSLDDAVEHINEFGTQHSEAIITSSEERAQRFIAGVDAAAVYVNASTRFTDGGVYGLGAEVGISTNKLHARGPIGLRELTTTKYVVHGDGHIRT